MNSAYFAPLVTKPTIITEPGSYRTRMGEVVIVKRVSTQHDFGCEGFYSEGTRENWHKSGRLFAYSECNHDILEKV